MAKTVLARALASSGHEVIDIGVNRDPEDFVDALITGSASAIAITTHNGVALTFGRRTADLCTQRGITPVIAMGGVLNEDMAHSASPVDVTAALNDLGILTPPDIAELITLLASTHAPPRAPRTTPSPSVRPPNRRR
jgi:methylmalonyl-CoA mutase cobalamin-binding subunit